MTRSDFESATGKVESWLKAIGSLTDSATGQAPISGGEFSGGWLLCGGDLLTVERVKKVS